MDKTDFTQHLGATVEWNGVIGVVDTVCGTHAVYPVGVDFGDGHYQSFYADGRFEDWHTEPSLKLVKPAREKKHFVRWINMYPDGGCGIHDSEQEANAIAGPTRTDCVKVEFDAYVEPEEW